MIVRRRYLVLALVGIGVIAAGSVPWPAGHLPLGAELAAQAGAALEQTVTIDDSAITLLPSPRIDFNGVAVGGRDRSQAGVARADRVSVHLQVLPLLGGQARARQVTVHRLHLVWAGPQQPLDLWLAGRDRLIAAVSRAETADTPLPERIAIVDGTVVAPGGAPIVLRRLNASVDWPSPKRPLDFHAAALWRGEQVDLRIDKLHPASLAAGLQSPVVLRLSAQPVSFSFAGLIGADDLPGFDGLLNFRTGSLARVTGWLGVPLAFPRHGGQMSVKSTARLGDGGLSMPDARIEIEGGTLEGALSARYSDSGRMLVSATLDAGTLDLNKILTPLASTTIERSPAGSLPAITRNAAANDADIRLSVSKALVGPLEMHDVAAGIMIAGGRMEFAVNQARLEGGSVRGRLQLVSGDGEVAARLSGAFERVGAQNTLHRLFGGALFSGPASGSVSLTAHGRSARQMAANLDGDVSVRIDGGSLLGSDLADVLARAQHSPLATALDWRGGRTPFSAAECTLAIAAGSGRLQGSMTANGIVGVIGGGVGVAQRTLDLRAFVRWAESQTAAHPPDAVSFPIEITGSWDFPIVTPDIRLLIERSSAVSTPPAGEPRMRVR